MNNVSSPHSDVCLMAVNDICQENAEVLKLKKQGGFNHAEVLLHGVIVLTFNGTCL